MSGRIDIERNIYRVAAGVARANWGPCLAATGLLVLTDLGVGYLEAPLAFAFLRALILMIVAYGAYRALLTGGAERGWGAVTTESGNIPWRFTGIMLIILGPILFLGVFWTSPGAEARLAGLEHVVLGLMMVVAYASLYIFFGTALPEVAERGRVVLREALERGWRNYRQIGRAMVFGPWVFRVASMLVMVGLALAGFEVDPYSLDSRTFQPASLVPLILFKASHVFAELMTAVVMTRAYRRHRGAPAEALAA